MDCGVPFCHDGLPARQPDPGLERPRLPRTAGARRSTSSHATNNFPEFTGRICPAPCEAACVLDINDDPVTIKQIELAIVDRAFDEGWVVPEPPAGRAPAASPSSAPGPAGLAAAAASSTRAGHAVTVYERDEARRRPAALRHARLQAREVDHRPARRRCSRPRACASSAASTWAATSRAEQLRAPPRRGGARDRLAHPRATSTSPGRDLDGVHFAMDYLDQRNRWVAAEGRPYRPAEQPIIAGGKRVVVIGGGDTGMDCVGNALREGARDAMILDVYPEPPASGRDDRTPWPAAPKRTLSTYALDEGGERRWSKQVTALEGEDGRVVRVHGRSVTGTSSRDLEAVPGSEFVEEADLVLIAIGFSGPEKPLLAAARGRRRPPRQRQGRHLRDLGRGRVRGRRRAHGAVADRVGHRRGPQVRPRRRPLPDRAAPGRAAARARGGLRAPHRRARDAVGRGLRGLGVRGARRRVNCGDEGGSSRPPGRSVPSVAVLGPR